ncbi:MAG: haloacid dehalogenase type II [Acidobacteria bacterium]|jgi:2-haloacid dehalogenase|nr:MAG: haloacid dehalogenase type II [Acidobacteriota bacterium]
MDFSPFSAITFDCYGTLINWEAGILPALRNVLAAHGQMLSDAVLLELYGEFEQLAEEGLYQSYRNVLESVVRQFGEHCSFHPTPVQLRSIHESIPAWPPFADTVAALQKLQQHYRLAVISNIDDDLFAESRKHLGVDFAVVVTAQQARSYKPSLNNFRLALQKLGIERSQLLHVGQSIYHDVIPAQSLGIRTVWVNRTSARPGVGAVRAASGKPDLEVPDVASLADLAVRA